MTNTPLLTLTALSAGILVAQGAFAQQSRLLEEITVTAQKREQNVNDVGISITARTGDQLHAAGVRESKDILRVAPGVLLDSVSSGSLASNLTIRGIAQSDFSPTQESPNSIYIDDVYLASSSAAAFPIYDLERVEILRGPQGTLFGRASSGGLAHFISKGPTEEFEGYAFAEYGRFNSINLEGAISGPISDKVRGRITGRFEDADGWWKNKLPEGKDTMENKFYGVRGQLEADLSENLVANLIITYDKKPEHESGNYKGIVAYLDPVTGAPAPLPADVDAYGTGPGNDFNGYRDPFPNAQTGEFNNIGLFRNEKMTGTLKLEWSGDDLTVTSISNYTDFEFDYVEDCDGGPVNYCAYGLGQELEQYSQELRATGTSADEKLVWTAGLYYLNISQDSYISFEYPSLSGSDFAFSDINIIDQGAKSYAAFGQLEYQISEKVRASFGLRYTKDERDIDSKLYYLELGNGYFGGTGTTVYDLPLLDYDFSPETVGALSSLDKDLWTGKLQLDYTPDDNTLIFISASRGQKGPGFNTNSNGALGLNETPYGSETVWAYEAGTKMALAERMVQLNVSGYYYDYNNFQGYTFAAFQNIVANYDGEFYGGELEINASPDDSIYLSLGISYLHSTLKGIPTYSGVQDQDGVLAPKWTINGLASKSFDVGPGSLTLQWSFDYIDDRYASLDNNFATFVPGSFVHNARVSYFLPDQDLEISAFVDNISDVDRRNFAFDLIASGGNAVYSYAKPRWWGVSLRKNF
ncbi:TonB-dependent receptor [Kordiimonas lipolytica]|uniref:TonB-dependent receptor n=1 Tax=Kordiimonas lipolytica TaxID=1662421 RepID=A0ABV8UD89_9PROT|nr:TonB-dependent receptor [Kordiimonas lipolytica]